MAQPSPGLYGADNLGNLFSINRNTGVGTPIGGPISPLTQSTEIEYDNSSGTAFSQDSNGSFSGNFFDMTTGLPTGPTIVNNVAFNGLEYVGPTLYGAGIIAGVTALIGPTGFGPIAGLAWTPIAGVMYGITGGCGGGGTSNLVTVNLVNGAATLVGNTGICAGSLEIGLGSILYAGGSTADGGNIYRINAPTGAATLVGPSGFAPVTGLTLVESKTPCCNSASGTPGCIDPAIEAAICASDPFCCDSNWDGVCVSEVTTIFPDNCDCCRDSRAAEGCQDPALGNAVSACVCASDPFCCSGRWNSLCVSEVTTLGCGVCAAAGTGPMTFSIDSQGPMVGVLDSFVGFPITEGDVLTTALPGPPGPNPPLAGIGIVPPGTEVGAGPGAPGIVPGGLGIFPGVFGCVEIDALSYGRDVLNATSVGAFSVDEFASGVGAIAPPDVFTEGVLGAAEASADVFDYLGPLVLTPPGPAIGNTARTDGDGLVPSGAPGVGLVEPNPPTPFGLPDPGDNLDAVDLDTTVNDLAGFIYFSLDSAFPDPLEFFPPVNCGTAAGMGFSGADVLVSFAGGFPALAIPGFALGLDLFGIGTDDLDALTWDDADGTTTLTPADTIAFSVRRGSAVIGAPDSAFGVPIEEGDVLTVPAVAGGFPAIFIAAEAAGLGTLRSGTPNPFGFADDVDAIDIAVPEPGFGLQIAAGLAFLVMLGRGRRKE
jgi:hypothetical protein